MSNLYHKIPGLYKRMEERPFALIEGVYREPELVLLKEIDWEFTEKVDGTNIRIIWDGHRVSFGGRTDYALIPSFLLDRLNTLFMGTVNEQVFEQVFGESEVVMFGEGFGPKIQKGGGNYGTTQDFVLFDVKIGGIYLQRESIEDIARKFDIKPVPVVLVGNLESGINLVRSGLKSAWGDFFAEGLVAKPVAGLLDRKGDRIITKIKRADFLGHD